MRCNVLGPAPKRGGEEALRTVLNVGRMWWMELHFAARAGKRCRLRLERRLTRRQRKQAGKHRPRGRLWRTQDSGCALSL